MAHTSVLDEHLLWFEHLPEPLEGLRLAHLSDLHVRRPTRFHERLIDDLGAARLDLVLLSGDTMHEPGHEPAAAEVLTRLTARAKPRLGLFGAMGNHDGPALRPLVEHLDITWLYDQRQRVGDLPLEIIGLEYDRQDRRGDLLKALLDGRPPRADERIGPAETPFRILLAHTPDWLHGAAAAGIDLLLAGHTHGGQVRLPGGRLIVNRLDWPLAWSSGILQLHRTRAVVTRGAGDSGPIENLRLFCPRQVPVLELHRGTPPDPTSHVRVLHRW